MTIDENVREKVIKHLKGCVDYLDKNSVWKWVDVRGDVVRAALHMIEETEPEVPYDVEGDIYCGHNCSECGPVGYVNYSTGEVEKLCDYCPECGRKVKWDAFVPRPKD